LQETSVRREQGGRLCQGDVLREVRFLERVRESDGDLTISTIVFPFVVVLSQDCDLEHDSGSRDEERPNHDKWLLSALVAPLYNAEHLFEGSHLSELSRRMQQVQSKTTKRHIRNNEIPRYHYFEFPEDARLAPLIADFKHYFSVPVEMLHKHRRSHYVCSIEPLFREALTARFAGFLSRIGLPEVAVESTRTPAPTRALSR